VTTTGMAYVNIHTTTNLPPVWEARGAGFGDVNGVSSQSPSHFNEARSETRKVSPNPNRNTQPAPGEPFALFELPM
jgi:hypothetical protein